MRWTVALVAALVLVVACSDDDAGPPLEVTDPPAAYRITYRTDAGTEVLTVARPFESRIETYDSGDGTGRPASIEITTFGRSSRRAGDAAPLTVAIAPGVAPGDARVEHLLGGDELERGGRKTIAGRTCDVYRTGQSLRLVELLAQDDGDGVEVCIDAAGLVLEEREGDRVRTATEVEIDPDLDERTFDVGERTIPVLDGGGAVQELTEDSRPPAPFWELGDDLPLPRTGRYAVVPPQPDAFSDPRNRGQRVATTTDVLTDGFDLIVVDRGGSLGSVDLVAETEGGEEVDLGVLGDGVLVHTAYGAEITVALGEGRFVRITGTLPDDELVAVARGLHEVDGGELTPVGEAW